MDGDGVDGICRGEKDAGARWRGDHRTRERESGAEWTLALRGREREKIVILIVVESFLNCEKVSSSHRTR